MYKTLTLLLFSILFWGPVQPVSAQDLFRVLFYNVENLFDPQNNPDTADDEFTPDGVRRWTKTRYRHKLQQIAKVILAAGEWQQPALVGLCEVENDSVLHKLTHNTSLYKSDYRYIISDGDDTRGINCGLLYARDRFNYLGHAEYPVLLSRHPKKKTRRILHVWGELQNGRRLDVMIFHFPSRYGGEKETANYRMDAAMRLRAVSDSLFRTQPAFHLLIMGDFSHTSDNNSLTHCLMAIPLESAEEQQKSYNIQDSSNTGELNLYSLFSDRQNWPGSHKYDGQWHQIDHIFISESLLNGNVPFPAESAVKSQPDTDSLSAIYTQNDMPDDTLNHIKLWQSAEMKPSFEPKKQPEIKFRVLTETRQIFAPAFLLTPDNRYGGMRPYRSYHGYRYEKGFSDHLPVLIDFSFVK